MPAEIRLLSYNVRSLRDDAGALARVIRAGAPDVVCVQEAPRFVGWRRRAARLGRATGLGYVSGGAPSCGTMIMSALGPVVEYAGSVTLPHTPGTHRRGLALAVLRFGTGARLAVVSCHLSLRAAERYRQAELLLERLDRLTAPRGGRGRIPGVVAGDLNDRPHGGAFRMLAGRLTDAWRQAPEGGEFTFPSAAPDRRIDAVLGTSGVEVLGCGVPEGLPGIGPEDVRRATDHLPLLARLRLPDPPRP
ncbi:endonuclease/exonuclease/phosphatase family protein [Streptomyces sp. NBC_01803]|uniref:endonuclease/exonuclease/phosphatase family protein n=1 Tax=Streptomyces sp. NBC_01803 TaxID=2975946 RepID=UPI002DD864A7|nr:endonuclease/exonuclease/phosphatase family protein [Streptomyces sp. NBC_01803]WSA46621.1 endonuclease/exonuclease/phosphatase family protein [Streptomyces sp. NBC_01803]